MIFLTTVADTPDMAHTSCPECATCISFPSVTTVNNSESMDRLLAGTLNSATCPSCGTFVASDWPVYIDLPEIGIRYLGYAPIELLEDDEVCASMIGDGHYQHVFYSLEELARQVSARLRLRNFQSNSRQTKLPI